MLTTALQQSIKIPVKDFLGLKEYACTCYGDNNDKNVFYVVPEVPIYAERDGKPQFMFYKYRGDDMVGGYAMFNVVLPQPDDNLKNQIIARLVKAIPDQITAKSKLIVTYIKANEALNADPTNKDKLATRDQALKNSGLTEEQATRYSEQYNPSLGDDQFFKELMPDESKDIELRQPNYSNAQVSLIIDDNKDFYRQIPSTFTPSGLGDNNTVFSLSLTGPGAALFEQALSGTSVNSNIGIRYNFNLDASLPAAKVTVSYSSEKTKEVSQTITHHTWSADEKKIERKFIEAGAISIKVEADLPADKMGMTAEQYAVWKKSLEDWGQKQVEQILSSQTGLDMSLDLLNDADGYKKFTESLSSTQSFTRTYEENSAVSFSIAPQNLLPSISSLVGQGNIDQYFKAYDLDDPFFRYLQPEFQVSRNLSKYNIENIVVTAKYANAPPSTLVFSKDNSEPQKTDRWYVDDKAGYLYRYSYVVNFSGSHAKPYHSGEIEVLESRFQMIQAEKCGVVYADITSLIAPQGWDLFSQVLVKSQYADKNNNIELKTDTQLLNATSPQPKPFIYPIGMEPQQPIYYSAEYYTKDGNTLIYVPPGSASPQDPNYATTRDDQFQIDNPLPRPQTYSVVFQAKNKDVELAIFEMTLGYRKYNFRQTKSLTVDQFPNGLANKPLTFNLMPDSYSSELEGSYKVTLFYSDGRDPVERTEPVTSTIVRIVC
ncbi:hypothetical protein TUM12370_16210 [Salmonella enterica subsp. enterica serovar Choleraesuis]|nr:hypothetical protein TUM12370_16210 [Salmonella enterica subsp. enterica serovar Choleraesuis]